MCGGFDWDDSAFERAYAELEAALFGEGHQYGALAPLIGITTGGATIELGADMRIRLAATGELAKLLARGERACCPPTSAVRPTASPSSSSSAHSNRARPSRPTRPASSPTRSRAIRLATAGAHRGRPCALRAPGLAPLRSSSRAADRRNAAAGEPTRLDSFRAPLAADLLPRLALADEDPELGEALDRWELSLFQDGPFQTEQLRESLAALLGGNDGLWAAVVRGACSWATRHEHARSCRTVFRTSRMPMSFGARSSRRCFTATARSSSPRSTSRSSGCARDR